MRSTSFVTLATLAALLPGAPRLAAALPTLPAITADAGGVTIHGRRTILLIGTFQPSRTDPSDWDRRLAQFAASGYNTIDCLVPWNFHEPEEGRFDFASPTHDLPRFLRLCQKHRLYVFLRSGPYVCDEWDGGGFPAWLIPKAGLEIRRPAPRYLGYVRAWVRALDQTIRPYQITRGGPVILNQLENELDYFGRAGSDDDRRAYLSALRDYARQDGLDIPLTACVGGPGSTDGPLRQAMGLTGGIIPTGNFYGGGAVEARARGFIAAVHAASAGGASLADVPVVCSETGRDEAGQRRLLAAGLKGISPFNFVSGSNFLFNNGDTNWDSPISYISTSVDFGGMISFSGVQTANWYAARRLAGFVNTVPDALGRARSDTSWEGGFSASNAALGADEGGGKPRRLYRLAVPNGPQFVFLWNDGGQAQATTLTVGALTLPRHSSLAVAPGYDHIVPLNLSLASWGLPAVTLRYATSELYHCEQQGQTTTLTLAADRGGEGEISLSAAPLKVFAKGAPARVYADGGDWTAAYRTGQTRGLTLFYGPRRLVIRLVSRQELDAAPDAKPAARDLLAGAVWRAADASPLIILKSDARRFDSPAPPTMEEAGLWNGAAWYGCVFDAHPAPTGAAPGLSLAHAGDLVTAYLNGHCLGTQRGVGNELRFDTAGAAREGANALLVRAEVWGHANFDDGRNPSLRLNSPRGMWGPVRLGDAPLAPAAGWRVTAEDPHPPAPPPGQPGALAVGEAGRGRWQERTLTLPGPVSPTGYVLSLDGKNVLGHLFVNGHPLGRCLFGPAADPHMAGGPSDQFYVPAAWLFPAARPNRLSLWTLAMGPDAALSKMDWTPVPSTPVSEEPR